MCPLVAYARILRHGRKRGYRIADSGYQIDGYLMTCQNNTEKPVLQTRLTLMYANKNCLLLCDALTISFSLLFIVNGLL